MNWCKIGLHSHGFARVGRPKESARKVLSFTHATCADCGEEVYWNVSYYHPWRIGWLRRWLCNNRIHKPAGVTFKGRDWSGISSNPPKLKPDEDYFLCSGCGEYVEVSKCRFS